MNIETYNEASRIRKAIQNVDEHTSVIFKMRKRDDDPEFNTTREICSVALDTLKKRLEEDFEKLK